MIYDDNTFWASEPLERYIAECLLSNISQGLPWHTHPNRRVVRAKIIPEDGDNNWI